MERFTQVTPLPTPQDATYTLSKAFESKHHRWLLFKSHRCASLEEANQLIKTALFLQKQGQFSQPLLPPVLSGRSEALTLTFMWPFTEEYQSVLRPNWSQSWPAGKEGYRREKPLQMVQGSPVKVFKGFHVALPLLPLVLKTFRFRKLEEANSALKEAFVQARVAHPNVCRLLDCCLYQSKQGKVKVFLALEQLAGDLLADIKRRADSQQPYEEEQLWSLLKQAVAGLAHAKAMVFFIQGVSHRDVKPANMLTDGLGLLKVSDFGSTWVKSAATLTSNAEGTWAYLAPEAQPVMQGRHTKYDPFKADVYSLGLAFLHLASLQPPSNAPSAQDRVRALPYSTRFKETLLGMLRSDANERCTLQDALFAKRDEASTVRCKYCQDAATEFCACSGQEEACCIAHIRTHTEDYEQLMHRFWPIAFLRHYHSPRFEGRYNAFLAAKQQILRAKTDLVNAAALRTIAAGLSTELSRALAEVETALMEDSPLFKSQYSGLVRACVENPDALQLFSSSLSALSASVRSAPFASVFGSTAFLYDAVTEQLTKRDLAVDFGYGGSYVELEGRGLLCIGGYPASAAVCLLDLSSFELRPWPALSAPRKSAGVANVGTWVYVFGGADTSDAVLRSCEKASTEGRAWLALGDMHSARGAFTPCSFRQLLYLVSVWLPSAVETFDPTTDRFTQLPVRVPSLFHMGKAAVCFEECGELCVLTSGKQMGRWKIESEREFRVSDTGQVLWSNQQPWKVGSVVLIASSGLAGVAQFSLDTYSFIKRVW